MATGPDVAHVRYRNALGLFEEFVRAAVTHPDAAALRGLERRFAERVRIQPSYWSQIKSRARQIGERLARQFEVHCGKPAGWMDVPHGAAAAGVLVREADGGAAAHDDEERFVVDLVLSYYRRDPRRARQRLLELLDEALNVPAAQRDAVSQEPAATKVPADAGSDAGLWARARLGAAPLKRRR